MGASDVTIEDCVIIGTAGDGIGHFARQNRNVTVRRCVFHDVNSRGLYLNGVENGLYQNNTFIRTVEPAALLSVQSEESTGGNLTIRSNTIVRPWGSPTFYIRRGKKSIGRVRFTDTLIIDGSKNNNVLRANMAEDVIIQNTEIVSFSPEEDYADIQEPSVALVRIESDMHVSGEGNTFSGGRLTRTVMDTGGRRIAGKVDWASDSRLRIRASADGYLDKHNPGLVQGSADVIEPVRFGKYTT